MTSCTLNFITSALRVEAASLVRTGRSFSLAIPLDRDGPIPEFDRRFNPRHAMLQTGTDLAAGVQTFAHEGWGYSDDMITMPLQCATQWDALSHIFHANKMYNGHACSLVDTGGAPVNSIDKLVGHITCRGVLIDVPRYLGVDWLALDHHITVEQLEGTLESQHTEVRSGDIVLIRTGNMQRARQGGGWDQFTFTDEPGVGIDAIPWFYENQIAGTANDTWSFEVIPSRTAIWLPFHVVAIVYLGLLVGEMFALDELAAACAEDGRYDFMLVAEPLPFSRAVGSPVSPIAIK
jgi:kynurenine formamidase